MISLSNLASGIDAFTSFCQTVTVPHMKKILLTNCLKELRDIYQLDEGFIHEEDKEGVLDQVYPKLLLSVNEVNQQRVLLEQKKAALTKVGKGSKDLSRAASNLTVSDSGTNITDDDHFDDEDDNITEEDKRRLVLPDGVYIGQVSDNELRHGHGKFIFNEHSTMAGHIYVGDWKVILMLLPLLILLLLIIIKLLIS